MSDAIYFKSPIDKASFDVKMTESVVFPLAYQASFFIFIICVHVYQQ